MKSKRTNMITNLIKISGKIVVCNLIPLKLIIPKHIVLFCLWIFLVILSCKCTKFAPLFCN